MKLVIGVIYMYSGISQHTHMLKLSLSETASINDLVKTCEPNIPSGDGRFSFLCLFLLLLTGDLPAAFGCLGTGERGDGGEGG